MTRSGVSTCIRGRGMIGAKKNSAKDQSNQDVKAVADPGGPGSPPPPLLEKKNV